MLTEQPASRDIEVWTENWQTVQVFADMLTQWNVGAAGIVGLRYEALPLLLKLHGVKRKQQQDLLDGLRVMEHAAITEINQR